MGRAKARLAAAELDALRTQQEPEQELSRTQIKKAMEELQKLGGRLVELKASELKKIPMSETLAAAIEESHRINQNEAKRRHLQYIGKVMRDEDADAISQALAIMDSSTDQHRQAFHQLERWRDGLLHNDQQTMQDIVSQCPQLDRQQLNNLVRLAQKESRQGKPPTAARKLFKYLRELSDL
ncbi:MAG: ribosome biogenesis factor YjgA [Gammaproteobacteria bacterium]|jgi:ribosome-associated protein|nr:ribosome biogenesis factor YjgA [Gammaproteobacteria bacterium]